MYPYPPRLTRSLAAFCMLGALAALSGCDYLGIEPATKAVEIKMAEGKAIGGACRHANRALEDCYRYNPKANKAAVFDGWRDMDGYMRENNLEAIKPESPPETAKPAPAKAAEEEVITEAADKTGDQKPAAAKH